MSVGRWRWAAIKHGSRSYKCYKNCEESLLLIFLHLEPGIHNKSLEFLERKKSSSRLTSGIGREREKKDKLAYITPSHYTHRKKNLQKHFFLSFHAKIDKLKLTLTNRGITPEDYFLLDLHGIQCVQNTRK